MTIANDSRKPVIADVARLAGVSVPTVSRVLTGNIPVSQGLRERVEAAIKELDYRPSSLARSLRSGTKTMIAIFAASTAAYGYANTLAGIEEAAQAAGYSVVISAVKSADVADVQAALEGTLQQQLAGIIVLDFDPSAAEVLKQLPSSIPTVAASGFPVGQPGFPYAFIDEYAAGRQATEHLLSLGHRTVHHLGLFPLTQFSGRYQGWHDALTDAGITPPPVLKASRAAKSGYEQGLRIAADPSVTAIFCSNDGLALAALRALHEKGVRVPEDVSIIGWDNQPFSEFTWPSLATVAPDFQDLGLRAFELLQQRLTGDTVVRDSKVRPALLLRESTTTASLRN
ncbi:LacI family DNA-binding transcriptional regulator [Arthrobacter sp. StoSoilB13]|uniref:LacI family DNA-binding transcriptional regulator n=1 Tax=Arthrobacter sp. StoSoilB13 TaxID=2830993 RepID=UPI001CC6C6FB|nr:LacI family DNA-binding transcriptional regulator [Arthrobacter sp. StoSoilB13]BCW48159.1 LacI family transcriptional regulator [Arthrobacter sp. StoSoilB13]